MRTFVTGLLVAGSLLILSACGGSSNSKLSYSAFSTAANKICKAENAQSAAAGGGATAAATPANAAALKKVLAVSDKSLAKLKALSGPSALVAAKNTFVDDVTANSAIARKAITAATNRDQAAYTAAFKQLQATSSQTNADASKLGAPVCAQS